jgi:hypothetical protein
MVCSPTGRLVSGAVEHSTDPDGGGLVLLLQAAKTTRLAKAVEEETKRRTG